MKSPLILFSVLAGTALLPLAAADNLAEAFAQGRFTLNLRLRHEAVRQTALRDASALTFRPRLAFTTAPLHGWKAMLEAESVLPADDDSYSQAGLNPGGAGRAVIADPKSTEINQAWLAFTRGQTTATVGRQRLVLDNARFVGDVGWRQNMQTFDAVSVTDRSLAKTSLTYAYLDQVNRVFSDRHAQGKWQSDSHLFNASYTGFAAGTLTGYAYLLDFKQAAAAQGCATYGASFAGTAKLGDGLKLVYRAELATQGDYGSSSLDYSTSYWNLEGGLSGQTGSLTLGREVLGSDHHIGFKTPLATLHAFNGWADLFLTTPAAGLRDTYLKVTASLPAAISLLAFQHWYETDTTGARLGSELNLQLSRKFGKSVAGLVKFADFRRTDITLPNVRKIWVQLEFTL